MKTIRFYQKAVMVLMAGAALAGVVALAGCSGPAAQEVTDAIDALEARVTELELKLEGKSDVAVDKEDIAASDAGTTYPTTGSYADYEGYLKALNTRVVDAIADSEAVKAPSDAAQMASAYQDAVTPLEDLEDEVGHLEDAFEAAQAQGYLTSDELAKLKSHADGMDQALDKAIDNLAKRMGVDK